MATTTQQDSSIDLADLIQRLPQELQNAILVEVIATPQKIVISRGYKPPVGLQLNQAIRIKTALVYFTTYTEVDESCVRWLVSLSKEHQQLLKVVQVNCEGTLPHHSAKSSFLARMHRMKEGVWLRRVPHVAIYFTRKTGTVGRHQDQGEFHDRHT